MKSIRTAISFLVLTIFAFNLSGCVATGTTVLIGVKRDATNFEQVNIYHTPPANYEVIAVVKASADTGWSDQEILDMAVEEVKKQAAKVGANGIILEKMGKESIGSFGSFSSYGYGGSFFASARYAQSISGTAIYVK